MVHLKNFKSRNIERALILFVLTAMFSSIVMNSRIGPTRNRPTLRKLDEGWYRYVDGQKYNVTFPCKITVPDGENLVIYYDGLTQDDGSKTIFTKGAVYKMRMCTGLNIIYEYEDSEFKRNWQMRSKLDCMGILPENPEDHHLVFTYYNDGTNRFNLKQIYLGRSGEALRKLWYDNLIPTLGVFAMSITAVVCFCAHIYMIRKKQADTRMGSAAMFLLLCSLWCLLESSFAQQVPGAAAKMSVISIYAFMCLPIPVLHFVQCSGDLQKHSMLQWLIYAAYGNVILQALAHVFLQVHYSDMVIITQLLHSTICTYMHYTLYHEYKANPSFENRTILQCIIILAVAGVSELILYWVLRTSYYGLALELGVLAFILRILCAILSSMTANIHFRTEAIVYKNMSREDRLTGLTNRRAFDETLQELEQHAHRYHNVALFFMDVNGLKMINDKYGHPAGDELIVSAAKAISSAFSEFGTCYRLGGDEFAAIVMNPEFTQEQWAEKIDSALALQNETCHYPLSAAWGVSYQRDSKRGVKRSNDWLHEADQAMYDMKIKMKATREDLMEASK